MEIKYFIKRMGMLALLFVFFLSGFAVMPNQTETVQAAAKPKLNRQSVRLIKGETVTLKLKGAKGTVRWSSTKKSVASVNKKGVVKARKKGSANIYAKYAGKSCKCKVWVETPKISKTKLELKEGQTAKLTVKGTKQSVTWKSRQPKIAEVNRKGFVTAKTKGTAAITAVVGKKKYQCIVTVKEKEAESEPQPQPEPEPQPQPQPQPEPEPQPQPQPEPQPEKIVSISVANGGITTMHRQITVTIQNDTDNAITVCDGFGIEKQNGDVWEDAWSEKIADKADADNNISIGANTGKEIECDFSLMMYGKTLETGSYRVCKAVYIEGQRQMLYAEFTVERAVLDASLELVGTDKIPSSQSAVFVVIKNNSNNPIRQSYNHSCDRLQKLVNNKWENVADNPDVAYPDVVEKIIIAPKEVKWVGTELLDGGEKCLPGKYRIVVSVGVGAYSADLYAYFEIVE